MGAPDEDAGRERPGRREEQPEARGRLRVLPRGRPQRLALAAIVLAALASGLMLQNWSDNQSSHYDLIRALDAGRTTIDQGPYPTKDRAFYHGHWYSARAPGLALYSLPFYETLTALQAPRVARSSPALRGEDEMIDFVGWWGSVLPAFVLMLLVWRVADRFEPRYGAAAAIAFGLGTMMLPFSTLLFSHVFSAMLGFAAFALLLRERDGPPRPLLLGGAGLAIGYAITSEYPLAFAAVVLGLYALSRPDSLRPGPIALRAGALALGAIVGIVPLLLYNHAAFHSWTHLAYADIPQQHRGFFGISAPSPRVFVTLLLDSRGLLTLSPVLAMGAAGIVLLFRRGRRAEALTIAGVCACYLIYNAGYYLPFGGGAPGPRFMITILPFLACPLGLALKRWPAPTVALAGASIAVWTIVTVTHPLVGYENETVIWTRLLSKGEFQPTIATALGAGRGWGGIWPILLVIAGAVALVAAATPRLRLTPAALGVGVLALAAWALYSALAPTALGIDHQGLLSIVKAGDATALNLPLHNGTRYPLTRLTLYCGIAGALALGAMWLARRERGDGAEEGPAAARTPAALGTA